MNVVAFLYATTIIVGAINYGHGTYYFIFCIINLIIIIIITLFCSFFTSTMKIVFEKFDICFFTNFPIYEKSKFFLIF